MVSPVCMEREKDKFALHWKDLYSADIFFFQEHIELEILNLLYSKCNLALEIRKSAGLGSVRLRSLLL